MQSLVGIEWGLTFKADDENAVTLSEYGAPDKI